MLFDGLPDSFPNICEPVSDLSLMQTRLKSQFDFAIFFQIWIVSMLNEPFLQDTSLLFREILLLNAAFIAMLIGGRHALILPFILERLSMLTDESIGASYRQLGPIIFFEVINLTTRRLNLLRSLSFFEMSRYLFCLNYLYLQQIQTNRGAIIQIGKEVIKIKTYQIVKIRLVHLGSHVEVCPMLVIFLSYVAVLIHNMSQYDL